MNIDQIKMLDPKRVIVLDVETTGLKPNDTDEILSLTIVDLEGTVLFNELVRPEKRKRWPNAQGIHGITPAMVKDKKPLAAYREQLQELWKRIDLVVGYNIEFDSDFLYSSSLALSPYVKEFDVMKEFAPIWGKWDDYHGDYRWAKLAQCAKYYKVKGFEAHTSLGDTEATRQCFLALINDEKYISGCHAMESMAARNRTEAQTPSSAPNKADGLDRVLIVVLIVLAAAAIINLFSEWQMSVTCAFFFIAVLLFKAYHDGKRDKEAD